MDGFERFFDRMKLISVAILVLFLVLAVAGMVKYFV